MRSFRTKLTRALGLAGLTAALALVAATPAVAGTASATFATNVTVTTSCAISAAPATFPALGLMTASSGFTSVNTTANLSLDCTAVTPVTLSLIPNSGGNGNGNLTGPGSAEIGYLLFQDSGFTKPWGTGTSALQVTSVVGTMSIPVYLEITATSAMSVASVPQAPGAYTGTVSVSASY
ncbi:spore coat protein U domain-containing protein [Dyella psychrodurans]|uniref:Spore coat protein U/FanG domain-containing protein n=1 Tax=Dyella psychrodurans TaxID=1927960 RepID=A0A370XC75_9GAMM|nr:spore coat protein U domain-containing protein [Dyella psychrodurans]RDS85841.1 hypothetical protein DWU99_00780 [Dyella psychrodurans]